MVKHYFYILLFLIGGLAAIAGSGYLLKSTYEITQYGTSAEGTVIELRHHTHVGRRGLRGDWNPVVRFTDSHGASHTFEDYGNFWSIGKPNKEGDKVKVRYVESDPDGAEIDYGILVWVIPLFLGVAGGFFLLLAWVRFQGGPGRFD
jgi:hypothetical protein